jgi:Zn-dependent protease
MSGSFDQLMLQISVWVLPALLAITLHEAAHGYVADALGDDTARMAGRISLNPFRHIDPFGTILLPGLLLLSGTGFLFGYAKPVPVNFWRLRNPRRDMVWVAAAGPGTNLALALIAAFLYHGVDLLPDGVAPWAAENLVNAIQLNVILAVFNMLPIPPLDGGRVAVGLLPDVLARPLARVEPYGIFIVLGAMFLLPMLGRNLNMDLNVLAWVIQAPATTIMGWIVDLAGLR